MTWCEATRPAVVLGSTQPDDAVVVPWSGAGGAGLAAPAQVDDAAGSGSPETGGRVGRAAGLDVARRRSGGGAVLLEPGRVVWADVVVPAGDDLWVADVGRAAWWLGETWATALDALGVPGAVVHRGGLIRSAWSAQVCFAGLGPGEVTVEGRKAVGISQRRTREGALFQCAVPLAWDPRPLLAALSMSPADRGAAAAALADTVLALEGRSVAAVEEAFSAALP